jgi:hypothetical protein
MALRAAKNTGPEGLISLQSAMSILHGDLRYFATSGKGLAMAMDEVPQDGGFARGLRIAYGCSSTKAEFVRKWNLAWPVRNYCTPVTDKLAWNDGGCSAVRMGRIDPVHGTKCFSLGLRSGPGQSTISSCECCPGCRATNEHCCAVLVTLEIDYHLVQYARAEAEADGARRAEKEAGWSLALDCSKRRTPACMKPPQMSLGRRRSILLGGHPQYLT